MSAMEHHEARAPAMGWLEQLCDFLAKMSLVATVLIVAGEVILRNTLGYSWAGTDEYASYLVVTVTFLSLSTCQHARGYHELEILKARLSPRNLHLLNAILHLVCLLTALVLLWQFSRLLMRSWDTQDVSATLMRTPYWVPQLFMPLGIAAFCISIFKDMLKNITSLTSGSSTNSGIDE